MLGFDQHPAQYGGVPPIAPYGPGSKPWIDFATTMMDSFLPLYDTAKRMNENAAKLRGTHAGDNAEEHF